MKEWIGVRTLFITVLGVVKQICAEKKKLHRTNVYMMYWLYYIYQPQCNVAIMSCINITIHVYIYLKMYTTVALTKFDVTLNIA